MGNTLEVDYAVATLTDGSELVNPFWRIDSGRDGPCLGMIASQHGNEVQGAEVARRFAQVCAEQLVAGSVHLIPYGNLQAVRARRHSKDLGPEQPGRFSQGHNIQQVWPGDPEGNDTERAAYALDQATEIVGGLGLMGRLGDNVRDRQGLAYYAFARMAEGFGDDLWSVNAGVNPANIERAVASILDEIRRLQDEPVTEQELADCQNYLIGVVQLHLETNDGLAATLNHIELFGLGEDYIQRYPGLVRSVTREAVQRAAQAHLTAERYSLAIAGPPGP